MTFHIIPVSHIDSVVNGNPHMVWHIILSDIDDMVSLVARGFIARAGDAFGIPNR